jgi:xanthine/uracil permease
MLRVVIGVNGLMIAYYGNRAPKVVAPSAYARQVTRVAGWSFVLSGLVYAGLWAFAPIPLAITAGTGAVVAGMIVTLGYCFWLRARADTQTQA